MLQSWMFWRLFLTYGLLVLGSVGVVGMVIVRESDGRLRRQVEADLRIRALLVRERLRGQPVTHLHHAVAGWQDELGVRVTLFGGDSRVLADSGTGPTALDQRDPEEVVQARRTGFGVVERPGGPRGEPVLYAALRADEPGPAIVRVAVPLDDLRAHVSGLRGVVWAVAAVTGAAALVLALGLARRVTQPMQELMAGTERIAAGSYGLKVYAVGSDEVSQLARTFNHMSERLAAQFTQLEEDRQQLRAVLGGMVEGVIALDAQQRILFANERAAELLDFQLASAVGLRFWEVVRQRPVQELLRRALVHPEPYRQELDWPGRPPRTLEVHVTPLGTAGTTPAAVRPDKAVRRWPPAPQGAVLVLHDTTELRRLERLRQEFVANVSHELKTPLTVIKSYVETLLDGAVDDPQDRVAFLEQVAEQADRLHALILDLLSLARIESGAELFEFEAVPLEEAVAECVERHRARAEARQQVLEAVPPSATESWSQADAETDASSPRLRVSLSPSLPLRAWADAEAVGQILDNLVDNALKYTPEGGRVWVRWRVENEQVCLEVQDTGIGIPERDLPRVFERFYRVDKARSRELGGTGLGLSIVKHLVQAMHGSVGAASRVGHGTTFTVYLPFAPAS